MSMRADRQEQYSGMNTYYKINQEIQLYKDIQN